MSYTEKIGKHLEDHGYIAGRGLTTTLDLATTLERPVLLEGKTGVGKTDVALTLSKALKYPLVRLQCYEGLDINTAVYEWNYRRQLFALKTMEKTNLSAKEQEESIFSKDYLLERPLLSSIVSDQKVVLLIDEVDRADEEFEAYLLELLSSFQITIPEMGTIKAKHKPVVVLTSNATRDLSDALRRRCLYYYLDYPSYEKEMRILRAKVPDIDEVLREQIVKFVQELRKLELKRTPGIAETLDWAAALSCMNVSVIGEDIPLLIDSLTCLLKTKEDFESVTKEEITPLLSVK